MREQTATLQCVLGSSHPRKALGPAGEGHPKPQGCRMCWGQNSRQCTAGAGTTASCARAPRTSSCLGRSGSPRTQFAHRPGSGGSGFGVGALRPPAPGCSTTLGASATPRAVGERRQGQVGPMRPWLGKLLAAPPIPRQPELALQPRETRNKDIVPPGLGVGWGRTTPSTQGLSLPSAHLAPLRV